MDPPRLQPERFVGLDVHKHYVMVAAVNSGQDLVVAPRRFGLAEFEHWASKNLKATDAVVLEATTNAWHLHDQLVPLVASVTVAHPLLVKLITSARVKTDPRDTINLARLLAAGLIPAVWVPPLEVRELRALVAHRQRLVSQSTQARNRLHSVLHRHNILPPQGDLFAASNRSWWDSLELHASEKLRVRQDLTVIGALQLLIAEVETELCRLSASEPWAAQVPFLVQLPGIGVLSAMVLLGAIGDISRFPSAKKLVGYSGLGASVHDSGKTHRSGRITKQGRKELRWVMVEAAWVAVEHNAYWKATFERLSSRLGKAKAIVAVARKLLTVIWHVLTDHVADRHAEVEAVARKMMTWATKHGVAVQQGLSRPAFARQKLDQLRLGADLTTLKYCGQLNSLPPPSPSPAAT
ncbi:MAG: IS110 family transposase [Dehalococcoidales bacterium]|nr:IS110 family transposase [Dehalococcoidales bacterium]